MLHAGWEIAILRIGRCFFEGAEMVIPFAFVLFFLATVVAVGTIRAFTTVVCSTMPVKIMVSQERK